MSTGHQYTKLLLGGIVTDDIHDFSLVHDGDAVGERANLVQFGGYQQDSFAGVALLDQAAVDKFDGTDIHAACRLGGDEGHWIAGELAGYYYLLLVAARKRTR